jgi:hypothetical protein
MLFIALLQSTEQIPVATLGVTLDVNDVNAHKSVAIYTAPDGYQCSAIEQTQM